MNDGADRPGHLGAVKRLAMDLALLLFLFPVRKIVRVMPWALMYKLAGLCGFILHAISGNMRKGAYGELKRHLKDYYTDEELKAATRRCFDVYVKRHFETLRHETISKEFADKYLKAEGLQNLDAALKDGKGAIILFFHFGSFFMTIPALAFRGYIVSTIIGSPELKKQSWAEKQVYNTRKDEQYRFPAKFLRADKSLKPIIKSLRENEVAQLVYDGRDGAQWIPVDFLGQTGYFSPGVLRIAAMTGAAILPTYIHRHRDDTLTMVVGEEYKMKKTEDEAEFFRVNTQGLAKRFEEQIIKYPCHFGIILNVLRRRYEKGIYSVPFTEEKGASGEKVRSGFQVKATGEGTI